MKRLLLLLSLSPLFAFSQDFTGNPMKFSHDWNDGLLILQTGDTVHCKLRYNRASLDGIVHVLDGDETITITTEFIREFSYYDSLRARPRKFVNMTLPGFKLDSQQFLVEKIYEDGRYTIINQRTFEMPYQKLELIRFLGKPVPVYKKYIIDMISGEIVPLTKSNAMHLLENHRAEVATYISDNHLRFKKISDFIDVFEYHNSL